MAVTECCMVETTNDWLKSFENSITNKNFEKLESLFHKDSYWRDILTFTWHIKTFKGYRNILNAFQQLSNSVEPRNFDIDKCRTAPRCVKRSGLECIESIFSFRTSAGKGNGVIRLRLDANRQAKAWTLLTALESLSGFEENLGQNRPTGFTYSKGFHGPNWLDNRIATAAFVDKDPSVLVVGGGQAGLSIATRLGMLNVDTLIIDREKRIGDNWRNRYHRLSLHNQTHVNHMPYMPFPPNWPSYIPKDKLAGWFEAYAESMELNFWTGTNFEGGRYDEKNKYWSVTLQKNDGTIREIKPRHIVMATGVSGIPNIPDISSLNTFSGTVLHSSEYKSGELWKGKKALVLGTGNSGHDIAQDLHANGAQVTMVQRRPSTIVDIEPSAQLPYKLYEEGPSLEDCDLITAATPFQLVRKTHQLLTEETKVLDKELLNGLSIAGFQTDFGEDNTGWQFKYLERGGGYYFNVGCSDLIITGKIGLLQFSEIAAFVKEGLLTKENKIHKLDLIVLATGFKGQQHLVKKLFGQEIAERVGPIWGFSPHEDELQNMFVRTRHPGLWFIAGSLAQCRIYSKYLGLQIKACEEGLISPNL